MLFNSIDFAVFLPLVFLLYWVIGNKNIRLQNVLLVASSLIFYGWWDWRFLFLLLFSALTDFYIGNALGKTQQKDKRKALLWASIAINISLLGFFKYFNFFIDNVATAFSFFGQPLGIRTLDIILPVGISFYTFQTISYSIDIYRRKLEPTPNLAAYLSFVTFFPQLVAGPIERAQNLLPQFLNKRSFSYPKAIEGTFQITWGLFKKIVIADNAAGLVNHIFADTSQPGSVLFLGLFLFTFQLYCDFSGYSDIAIGTAKLFGISLMTNFKFPYFSRDVAEFWRRWHISLNTWFRDYIYIPLGGSKGGKWSKVRNTYIIFLVAGLWHGANWTFIIYALLNATYFLPLLLTSKNRFHKGVVAANSFLPTAREFAFMLCTFGLTMVTRVFFRAETVQQAFQYLSGLFTPGLFSFPRLSGMQNADLLIVLVFIAILITTEWMSRKKEFVFENIYRKSILAQALTITILVSALLLFTGRQQEFIYFQF